METVEILAGAGFANAVRDLGLASALCTYRYQPPKDSCCEDYQIWLLSKEDFDNICSIDDGDWKDAWGWWRYATGSNISTELSPFCVNGVSLIAWDGREREDFANGECALCENYYLNSNSSKDGKYPPCYAEASDQESCCKSRAHTDLLFYLNDEIGTSTEKNVCALTVDLARINGVTLSELFKNILEGI